MGHQFLPVNLRTKDKKCLIVGGGKVALRKISTLLDYECSITVIAPEFEQQIEYFAERKFLNLVNREYKSPEAATFDIVIAASDNAELNEQVANDCRGANVPVNVVDTPRLCDFTFPAILRRDCLTVSVSTDGQAPFLSGQLRIILETVFPDRWSRIAQIAAKYRKIVVRMFKDNPDRKLRAYERFLNADWKTILEDMKDDEIEEYINTLAEGPEEQDETGQ
jgi:siroheme synthase-like protein